LGINPIEIIEKKNYSLLWDNFDLKWDKERGIGKI
jgi:hypothetical protein